MTQEIEIPPGSIPDPTSGQDFFFFYLYDYSRVDPTMGSMKYVLKCRIKPKALISIIQHLVHIKRSGPRDRNGKIIIGVEDDTARIKDLISDNLFRSVRSARIIRPEDERKKGYI